MMGLVYLNRRGSVLLTPPGWRSWRWPGGLGTLFAPGSHCGPPLRRTAESFIFAMPFGIVLAALAMSQAHLSMPGVWCAVASGALASGGGYAVWYAVLPSLSALGPAPSSSQSGRRGAGGNRNSGREDPTQAGVVGDRNSRRGGAGNLGTVAVTVRSIALDLRLDPDLRMMSRRSSTSGIAAPPSRRRPWPARLPRCRLPAP